MHAVQGRGLHAPAVGSKYPLPSWQCPAAQRPSHLAAPTCDGLAQHEDVGLQAIRPRVAAGPRTDGVGLIDDEQGACAAAQLAQGDVEARFRVDDADIRHYRLTQDRRHFAVSQRRLQCRDVVELDHLLVGGWMGWVGGDQSEGLV